LGAEENLLNSLIAGVDVSAAKQPLLPAAATLDSLTALAVFSELMNSFCCHSF
jgi:hypothetical protein